MLFFFSFFFFLFFHFFSFLFLFQFLCFWWSCAIWHEGRGSEMVRIKRGSCQERRTRCLPSCSWHRQSPFHRHSFQWRGSWLGLDVGKVDSVVIKVGCGVSGALDGLVQSIFFFFFFWCTQTRSLKETGSINSSKVMNRATACQQWSWNNKSSEVWSKRVRTIHVYYYSTCSIFLLLFRE